MRVVAHNNKCSTRCFWITLDGGIMDQDLYPFTYHD